MVTHAQAAAVEISVHLRDGVAELLVRDDGVGLPPTAGPHARPHFGLRLLHEAAAEANGRLVVRPAPGGGTELHLAVPLP